MMPRNRWALLLLPLMLAACGETKEALGFGRVTPDEFAVVDRPALSIPPDFKLRPPQPGAPRPQEQSAAAQAEQAVFGQSAPPAATPGMNGGDLTQALLTQAGAAKADPNIRRTIDRELHQTASGDRHLVDDLLWWRKDNAGNAAVVDAVSESQRVRGNQAAGKPVNAGATPVIEKRKSGWLGL